ncbi:gas vesicle protein [Thalassobacillus hwangdonensis]|uniref:Gas vesicle protein n=1 Tax=Thalassobacillus hwangdonensis TaxID=546108 RepID=A0ABW3L5A5_9BACI
MTNRQSIESKEVSLLDILDVVLDKGVAIKGDLIISIAGVDLVYLDLRLLISAVETLAQANEQTRRSLSSDQFDLEKEGLQHATAGS